MKPTKKKKSGQGRSSAHARSGGATVDGKQNHRAPQALLVLGMHRSGTSAITRVLSLLGGDLPKNLLGPNFGNETGHWESRDLLAIHEDLLASAGSRWDDWRTFNPDWYGSAVAAEFKQRLLDQLQYDFGQSHFFVIKDPRICRFVPLWLSVLDEFGADIRVIIPFRNPIEVAASLKQRDNLLLSKSYLLWLRHILDAEQATRHVPRALITYQSLVDDWRAAAAAIATRANLRWPRRSDQTELEIDRFLIGQLRHHVADPSQLAIRADIVDWVKNTYETLSEMADGYEDTAPHERLDEVRTDFDKASAAFGLVLAEETEYHAESQKTALRFSEELNHERQRLTEELLTTREEIARTEQDVAELSEKLTATQTTITQREEEVTHSKRETARLQNELNLTRTAVTQRDEEVSRLSRELDASRQFLRDSQTEVQHLAGDLDIIRLEIARKSDNLDAARLETARNADKLREVRQAFELRGRQIDNLSTELQSAKTKSVEVDVELARLNSELADTRWEVSQRQVKVTDLGRDLNVARTHLDDLQATIKELAYYLHGNSQVASAGTAILWRTRLKELLRNRAKASRQWEYDFIRKSQLFDGAWYLNQYPDVAAAKQDPLWHYILHGAAEGRDPHPLFDTEWYQSQASDLTKSNMTALGHYLSIGVSRALDPHPLLDTSWYFEQNPDVVAARDNPLHHFFTYGAKEGRNPHPLFDTARYAANHPEVSNSEVNPLVHYVRGGASDRLPAFPELKKKLHSENINKDLTATATNRLTNS